MSQLRTIACNARHVAAALVGAQLPHVLSALSVVVRKFASIACDLPIVMTDLGAVARDLAAIAANV
jgi:hypothetical protein